MIQSIDRAVRILFALQGERRLGIAELAARLELPPSTIHGIVKSLVEHGMVSQDPGSGRYQLGHAVLRLGNVYLDSLELRARSVSWCDELVRRTGCAARVGVLAGEDVMIIHHVPRPDGSRQMPEIGIVMPTHASALGKAMLAFRSQDADRVLAGPLRSMTGETVTAPDALRDQLRLVATRAFAEENDETVLGESSVAAPIFDASGSAIGAVSIVMPSNEWPPDEAKRANLREVARNISRELGADGWPATPANRQ